MPIIGIIASANWASANASSYDSIASQTLGSNTASVTFSSIPSTYQHLQIRFIGRSTRAAADANIRIRVNSDTATNYAMHDLYGDGTTAGATGSATQTYADLGRAPGTSVTNTSVFGVGIIDLLDYTSTSKNKTFRSFWGYDTNATPSSLVGLRSGLWISTSAVTSITLFQASSASWLAGSTIALYGIKG